jgi:hypothetical protein
MLRMVSCKTMTLNDINSEYEIFHIYLLGPIQQAKAVHTLLGS